jgi:hypothetical protein
MNVSPASSVDIAAAAAPAAQPGSVKPEKHDNHDDHTREMKQDSAPARTGPPGRLNITA